MGEALGHTLFAQRDIVGRVEEAVGASDAGGSGLLHPIVLSLISK